MEILAQIRGIVDQVNNLLWGKNILVVLLIGAAILATLDRLEE